MSVCNYIEKNLFVNGGWQIKSKFKSKFYEKFYDVRQKSAKTLLHTLDKAIRVVYTVLQRFLLTKGRIL